MKKKGAISKREFSRLSEKQQIQELQKMAKRSNVRLSLLEENDTITLAYRQAYEFNLNEDREQNRFSEGKKQYKTKDDIQEGYKALSSFLNNKSSTLGGVQENIHDIIGSMTSKIFDKKGNTIDENVIKKMSLKEKEYASKYIAQASNEKLKNLKDNGITQNAYSLAATYNKVEGRKNNTFYRGIKFKNEEELNKHLDNMIYFYNSKTSTVEGYQDSISKTLDNFRKLGIEIPEENEEKFFQFLASDEFKKVSARYDSEQVAEALNEALKKDVEVEKIKEEYRKYLDSDMTFDQVQERLGTAKWLLKKE